MLNFSNVDIQKLTDPDIVETETMDTELTETSSESLDAPKDVSSETEKQIRANEKKITILFCIPGREFSREFLVSWTRTLSFLLNQNVEVGLSQSYSSMVHVARAQCLGGDNLKGAKQMPFQSKVDYDFLIWIDSDIIFTPQQVLKLIQSPHPITCGIYMMQNNQSIPVVKDWDKDYFLKNGTFQFLTMKDVQDYKENVMMEYMSVHYAGMGFMCLKKGVLEKLTFPWFASPVEHIGVLKDEQGNDCIIEDILSEDVYFCKKLKEAGFEIMLDCSLRVGHLKSVIL